MGYSVLSIDRRLEGFYLMRGTLYPIGHGRPLSTRIRIWSYPRRISSFILILFISEGLPGVLGNKGTWPMSTREQGNKDRISKGTRERKTFYGTRKQTLRKGGQKKKKQM